jgi:hypothetical protein
VKGAHRRDILSQEKGLALCLDFLWDGSLKAFQTPSNHHHIVAFADIFESDAQPDT